MILLDDRIGAKELRPHIPQHTPVKVQRLQYADAAFLGKGPDGPTSVAVERKRIGDLVNSIDTGRLSGSQLLGLLAAYNRVILLIEGLYRPNPTTGILEIHKGPGGWKALQHGQRKWMMREVNNYLHSLSVHCGIIVWKTATIAESGQWLADTYHYWQKDWDSHRAHLQFYSHCQATTVELFRPPLVARVAKELDGLGWDRSRALAAAFGSVLELVMADEKQLKNIQGIGKKLAQSIVKELRGEGDR